MLPQDVTSMRADGIKLALRTLLAHKSYITRIAHAQGDQLANTQGTLPQLFAFAIKKKNFASLSAHNPALLRLSIAHHSLCKAHPVVILSWYIAQMNADTLITGASCKFLPRGATACEPI